MSVFKQCRLQKWISLGLVWVFVSAPASGTASTRYLAPASRLTDQEISERLYREKYKKASLEDLLDVIAGVLKVGSRDAFLELFDRLAPLREENEQIFRAFVKLYDALNRAGEDALEELLFYEILDRQGAHYLFAAEIIASQAEQARAGEQSETERKDEQAEVVPRTQKRDFVSDPRKNLLIKKANALQTDGQYSLSDLKIARLLGEFETGAATQEEFEDTSEVQEMIEVLGQRYGLTTLRIPDNDAYRIVLKNLRAMALVWRALRREPRNPPSPLTIYREITAFREGVDPRIIFDVYLHLLGEQRGKEVLEHWSNVTMGEDGPEEEVPSTEEEVPLTEEEDDMIGKLDSYLRPEGIEDLFNIESDVLPAFRWEWLKLQRKGRTDRKRAPEVRLPWLVTKLQGYRDEFDLAHHSGFPLIHLALSFRDFADEREEEVPLYDALGDLEGKMQSPEGRSDLYQRSTLEVVDDLARKHTFSKPLSVLKEELREIVLPEDRRLIAPMFEYFTQEQLDVWNHVVRVTKLAYMLAQQMGMEKEERQMLLRSSLAHDLGKRDPDIAPLLELPRRLTPLETLIVAMHGPRSAEIAGMLNEPEKLAAKFHNFVQGATSSKEYQDLEKRSKKEAQQFQRILYTMYAADFLDAVFDYSRTYQRDRPPFDMGRMSKVIGWFERVLKDKKKETGKDPIDRTIVRDVRNALMTISKRALGRATGSPQQHKQVRQFRSVLNETLPFWTIYQLLKMEKKNYRLWNASTFKERTLEKAREEYFRRVWRSPDSSMAAKESIFEDVLMRHESVRQSNPDFSLDLYLNTVVRFPAPLYRPLEPELDQLKATIRQVLAGRGWTSAQNMRQGVIREFRKLLNTGQPQARYVAAMMMGIMGSEHAITPLAEAATVKVGKGAWMLRRAGVDVLGILYEELDRDSVVGRRGRMSTHLDAIAETLTEVVAQDKSDPRRSPKVRQRAMYILRNVKHPHVFTVAKQAVQKDPSWRIRDLALKNLQLYVPSDPRQEPEPEALRLIVHSLADAQWDVRKRAQQILIHRADRKVIHAILEVLDDPTFDAKMIAWETLYDVSRRHPKWIVTDPKFIAAKKRENELKKEGKTFLLLAEERRLLDVFDHAGIVMRTTSGLALKRTASLWGEARKESWGMSLDAKKLLWMLTTPASAQEEWMSNLGDLTDKREVQRLSAQFLYRPMAEWKRCFVKVKKSFGTEKRRKIREARLAKAEQTWKELRGIHRRFANRYSGQVHADRRQLQLAWAASQSDSIHELDTIKPWIHHSQKVSRRGLLVHDGYDWSKSLIQNGRFPTLFHGTSSILLRDIKKNGLRSHFRPFSDEDYTFITMLEEKYHVNLLFELTEGLSLTLDLQIAKNHARLGPEILKYFFNRVRTANLEAMNPEDSERLLAITARSEELMKAHRPVVLVIQTDFDPKDLEGPSSKVLQHESEFKKILEIAQGGPVSTQDLYERIYADPFVMRKDSDLTPANMMEIVVRGDNYLVYKEHVRPKEIVGIVEVPEQENEVDTFIKHLFMDASL